MNYKKLVTFFVLVLSAIPSIPAMNTKLSNTSNNINAEDEILLLEHCKKVAEKVNLGDVSFNFDENAAPQKEMSGYYNPKSKTIWLHLTERKQLLFNIKTKSPVLTWADFTLLHELGHYDDCENSRTLTKSAILADAAKTGAIVISSYISLNLPADLSNISSILKDINNLMDYKRLSPKSVAYSQECYADQFAATKLYEIHGFKKTKEYLTIL
jgi:hypothetical protein